MSLYGIAYVLNTLNNDFGLCRRCLSIFVLLLKRPTLIGFTVSMLGYEKFVAHRHGRCQIFIGRSGPVLLMLSMGYKRPWSTAARPPSALLGPSFDVLIS